MATIAGSWMTPLDTAESLASTAGGAESEALRLFSEHGPGLYRFCRSTVGSGADAEDIVQDTFLKLLQHLQSGGNRSNLKAWLFTVAANACRDRARWRLRWLPWRAELDTRTADPPDEPPDMRRARAAMHQPGAVRARGHDPAAVRRCPIMLTLLARTCGRIKWVFAAVVVLLSGVQISLIAIAGPTAAEGNLERLAQAMPAFVREVLGPAFTSFAGVATIGYWDPVLVLVIVVFATFVATEPAGDVEAGLVDLMLARPLPRHWLVTRSAVAMAGGTAIVITLMGLATLAGLELFAPPGAAWPTGSLLLILTAHLAAIAFCFGAAALAAATFARRRIPVVAGVGLTAIAMYVLNLLAMAWPRVRSLGVLSPFHYYDHRQLLAGTGDTAWNLSVLLLASAAGISVAYWQWARRDL